MEYGYFDVIAKEYVITRPDTPRPWSNYLGSAEFGGVITNNAAGYTFYRSAAQGRLSRYIFNAQPAQLPGRFVYLHDVDDGDYWSNSWMPVGKALADFKSECRHGAGYTVIRSTYRDIRSEVAYFTTPGALYEIWRIEVANIGAKPRRLHVFPFIEPQCNWNAQDDMNNLQYNQYIATTEYANGLIDIGSNINMPEDPEHFTNKDQARHAFFGVSSIDVAGYDGDLTSFMGPYGRYANPQAVVDGQCSNSTAAGDMPCAALQVDLELAPGESRHFACVFGVGKAEEAGRVALDAVRSATDISTALDSVKARWRARIENFHAETPDPAFSSMVNMWAPYNSLMTFYWSRTANLVYAGERDGLGFRDTLQDMVASACLVPEETRERLELMLTGQYANGGCKPVVQPFNHSPGAEPQPDHYRSDDALWFFNAVPAYVKETGRLDFYRTVWPYADRGQASVFGHLRRALEFSIERSGVHGLPCGLYADWNDCLRLGEEGESVFVAMQLRYALREYVEMAHLLSESREATWASEQLARLDRNLEDHAWDGAWYLRAFHKDGMKYGSKDCGEGRIFMNPQTWAVLSGHATGSRAHQIMDSLHEHLATDYGVMICTPPYTTTDPEVCLARLMNPGMKENGGIFNHTQGWGVMAAAQLGMGDRAWAYMRSVMPASYNAHAEIREVEPYVVCQSTHSRFSPRCGAGRLSWLSGAAAWNYIAMTTAILGIQPTYHGLRIDPCIPAAWTGFKVRRYFRGATYQVEVQNPAGRQKGIRELTVDGHPCQGTVVPPASPGDVVQVFAVL